MLVGTPSMPQLYLHSVSCPSEGSLVTSVPHPEEIAGPVGGAVSLLLSCQQAGMYCQRSRCYDASTWEVV